MSQCQACNIVLPDAWDQPLCDHCDGTPEPKPKPAPPQRPMRVVNFYRLGDVLDAHHRKREDIKA